MQGPPAAFIEFYNLPTDPGTTFTLSDPSLVLGSNSDATNDIYKAVTADGNFVFHYDNFQAQSIYSKASPFDTVDTLQQIKDNLTTFNTMHVYYTGYNTATIDLSGIKYLKISYASSSPSSYLELTFTKYDDLIQIDASSLSLNSKKNIKPFFNDNNFQLNSAAATGDPYITPIYGNLYKLPNRTAFYRLLKHNDTIINGEVLRFDEANVNKNCALLNFQMDKFAPEDFNINSMYFFKNIYISHDGKETVYNLLDKTFTIDCFDHTFTQTKLETCKIYYYENMEACEIDLGGIQIKLCTFDNPQIISGIELKANEDLSNASGLLVHQQSSKPHMLKTIKSKKETYKVEKHGRVVKEHFVTKTHSGTETIIRDITVL